MTATGAASAASRGLATATATRARPAAWLTLVATLALAGLAGGHWPATLLDWQPAAWPAEPWRAVTPVAVHYSGLHLAANLAGATALALLGWAAPMPPRCALAWALAWPLTHLGLLVQPQLIHYGGLSGVLHAGVAVVAVHSLLAAGAAPRRRAVGAAMLAVLAAKLLWEAPWGAPLRHPAGWDIAVAPLAHATGAVAGAGCAAAAELALRLRRRRGLATAPSP